ncbi:MAG: aldo/keto reductase [Clostridia bacterium]|nr:aldo/keto reductase [Clostridia bacterium]
MSHPFKEIKKNFGFGFMRLPMDGDKVNTEETCKMVDCFMQNGFNYFDTAHGYLQGLSEKAIKTCLSDRYPRESFVLTTKLSNTLFSKTEDIRPLFETQLADCGVDYFDFYLMHAQDKGIFERYKKLHAYETALEFLKEGKIKHFGISFHDKAEVLEQILTEYPQIEVVQIQLNYVDYEDPAVDSRRVYEVCQKYGKPVIIMEPVKGGRLANLPQAATDVFDRIRTGSNASYALRFAAGFEDVFMTLSGMSNLSMVEDNVSFMREFKPLNEEEQLAVKQVCAILKQQGVIPCTACRYCTDGCPKQILIPDLFACLNAKKTYKDWNSDYYYSIHTKDHGHPGDCIGCGKCEAACPQHLEIRALLKQVSAEFDKRELDIED